MNQALLADARIVAVWAYDFEGERIAVTGVTKAYVHGDKSPGFHFCAECGCVAYWRTLSLSEDGRRRIAVHLRLADPDRVGAIAVDHLDGLASWGRHLCGG